MCLSFDTSPPFFREHQADKERSKETPMKNTSLLLTVS